MIGRTREERKAAAAMRARLALKQSFERIDFDFDVVQPEIERMRKLAPGNDIEVDEDKSVKRLNAGVDLLWEPEDVAW
jgi:hypothetical protein